MFYRLVRHRSLLCVVSTLLVLMMVHSALAWQTVINSFEHNSPYGGEAQTGHRTGSVEYTGSERRIRAGADNIVFTQAQINWNKNSGTVPALVFHVAPKNAGGGTCNNIRVPGTNGWNWTNLPGANITIKGCSGAANEVRFHTDDNQLSASASYYIQSLYKDTGYNGSPASKSTGQINVDTYATNWMGGHDFSDFHGKVCINADTTNPPNSQNLC